ncbi:hypothetical protein TVAG_327750 [Trichomonas vaginalis G3]|uniref:Uncharacterized protein n=1 Tax=Trichomonas vaginalis (strain ATCC PRA-98 / G3) TaxID=412133 RepID=A2G077_TRIV3|nr:hypothetical protein TVAGG3_0511980 [Trichomonas vaginalis G3]EAX89433.1 hypothetical protein TVAG_327750 [Trichomonas vaginalis G3]KAI5517848.1 hypothetical protein TVAGG3_0511980 [Trichomonas vaginalis G3]|eukprot:XP_001302363.1 hypothetical protein [Trichomonas vaginalis G3]
MREDGNLAVRPPPVIKVDNELGHRFPGTVLQIQINRHSPIWPTSPGDTGLRRPSEELAFGRLSVSRILHPRGQAL